MIASNIDRETLELAAHTIGVEIDLDQLSGSGRRFRVKLTPAVPESAYTPGGRRRKGEAGDAKYQRTTAAIMFQNSDRRVHAVCWHGFRDFFRTCFQVEPEARFYTALDRWLGSEDFEARYRRSGTVNIGSQIAPVSAAEACRCSETGTL